MGAFHVRRVTIDVDGTIQYELGYPDSYSDGPVYLERGPSAPYPRQWDIDLGDGWWLTWDAT